MGLTLMTLAVQSTRELGNVYAPLTSQDTCTFLCVHLSSCHIDSHDFGSADASLSLDGCLLAISNMLTGFKLFQMQAPGEVEPLHLFKQDVRAGDPVPICFLHGDHAIVGGTSHGQVNVWDVFSHLKQSLHLRGMHSPFD